MIQFETFVNSSKSELDENALLKSSLYEDDQKHIDFDAIIINLNAELDSKKQEIQALFTEISELNMQIKKTAPIIEKSYVEKTTPLMVNTLPQADGMVVDEVEEKEIHEPRKSYNESFFETRALDIEKIEQSLYSRDNRVEVTRL